MRSRHVGVVIRRPAGEVYDHAREPSALPSWAEGLASGPVESDGDELRVDSPMGRVHVRFAPRNDVGVLDHDVTLPDGTTVHNPLRVLPHPEGAEVVFTLRQLGSDDEFERDAAMVAADLARLKRLLEDEPAPLAPGPGTPVDAVVRLAGPDDGPTLGRLLHAFNTEFDCPVPDVAELGDRFRRLLDGDDVLAVLATLDGDHAVGADDAVGFALVTLRPTPYGDGPLAQLEELYVRADLRSGGVGSALLDRAVTAARGRGAEEMHINVDSDDVDARRFYARHGYSDADPDTGSGMRCYLRRL